MVAVAWITRCTSLCRSCAAAGWPQHSSSSASSAHKVATSHVGLQAAVAAFVKHGQGIDGAIERQRHRRVRISLAQSWGMPAACRSSSHSGGVGWRIPSQVKPWPAIPLASRLRERRLRYWRHRCSGPTVLCSHCVLAAEAVLQQDQFGVGRQSRLQLGNGALGVVGFARHQQAMNRLWAVRRFTDYRVSLFYTLLEQGQPLAGLDSRPGAPHCAGSA